MPKETGEPFINMRYALLYFVLIAALCMSETTRINNFTGGYFSPLMEARSDFGRKEDGTSKYQTGCRQLENMIVFPQGTANKRPGTKLINAMPVEVCFDNTAAYPTLHELDASEIPAKPEEPADTALSGAISITNKAGLQAISGSNHYSIDANIDASGSWTPIANFTGIIEGNGNTISGLTVNLPTTDWIGMFSNIGSGCEIRNLTFNNCSVTGDRGVSILAGRNNDNTTGVKLSDISFVDCTVTANDYAACLLATHPTYDISGSFDAYRCTTSGCTVTTSTGTGTGIASLLGVMDCVSGGIINVVDCHSTGGSVAGGGATAGLIYSINGHMDSPSNIHSCYSTTPITFAGTDTELAAGGLINNAEYANITSCYTNTAISISGNNIEDTGGFAHEFREGCIVVDCYSSGSITGDDGSGIGGFVGDIYLGGVIITRCYSTVSINLESPPASGGGLEIGGFIGSIEIDSDPYVYGQGEFLIDRCWSTGDITCTTDGTFDYYSVGGFAGLIEVADYGGTGTDFIIQDCYSWSSVLNGENAENTSGFIGDIDADIDVVDVINCYCAQTNSRYGSGLTNQVAPDTVYPDEVGAFLGYISGFYGIYATSCFFDNQTQSQSETLSSAEGKDTATMMTKATYTDAGWLFSTADGVKDDINSIWTMPVGGQTCYSQESGDLHVAKLIPFEYSTNDTYILAFGTNSLSFYRAGGQIED
jgi:hypothetical protein